MASIRCTATTYQLMSRITFPELRDRRIFTNPRITGKVDRRYREIVKKVTKLSVNINSRDSLDRRSDLMTKVKTGGKEHLWE